MRALLLALLLGAASLASLEERAEKEWRHHDYAAACRDFQKLAWIDAKDAPAHWLALGQCEAKLGKKKEAVAAVRRAERTGDAPTRLRAYASLAHLEVKLAAPAIPRPSPTEPAEGDCVQVLASEDCGPIVSCRYVTELGGESEAFEVGLAFAADAGVLDAQAVGAEDVHSDAWSDPEHGLAGLRVSSFGLDGGSVYRRCTVVAANPCSGRIGVVCDGKPAELSLKAAPDAGLR